MVDPSTTNSTSNAFPQLGSPLVDNNGFISIPWYRLLIALWNRTGGSNSQVVSEIDTGVGLTGGPITTTGTIKLAQMPGFTLKGNAEAVEADPQNLSSMTVKGFLNYVGVGDTAGGDLTGNYPDPTITANAVTNDKLAQMPGLTLKGNANGGAADPQDLNVSAVKTLLNFIQYGDTAGGDLIGTYPDPTITANAVTNVKLAQMPGLTLKGNNTLFTASPLDLTTAQVADMLGIGQPNFQAYLSANQTIPNSAFTKVIFDTTVFDSGGFYSSASGRFQPGQSGLYKIHGSIVGSGTTVTNVSCAIFVNGVASFVSGDGSSAPVFKGAQVSALIQLNGTSDYVEIFAYITSGGTNQVVGAVTPVQSFFEGQRVGF